MNKKLSIAVGSAAVLAFAGSAYAVDQVTMNMSEGYVDNGAAENFIPDFVRNECKALPGAESTGAGTAFACGAHGSEMPGLAAATTAATENFWASGIAVPLLAANAAGGWWNANNEIAFGNNIWSDQNGDGTLDHYYFNGIATATNGATGVNWTDPLDAIANPELPLGAPTFANLGSSELTTEFEFWIDQIVVGYVVSKGDSAMSGGNGNLIGDATEKTTLIQNFRSQLAWVGSDFATTLALVDQRLEQSVDLGDPAYEASRQTFQQAFQVVAGPNHLTDPEPSTAFAIGTFMQTIPATAEGSVHDDPSGSGIMNRVAQMVSQDAEGYFFSCMNCDSLNVPTAHRFAPIEVDYDFMPWSSGWHTVPTIQHGPTPQL
ncbi:MAG: hypothetical protein ACE5FN_01665 [Leptospirillia bacterium]